VSGTKENLLGNGTLTVAARIMSTVGVPLAAVLLGFLGTEIWGELKAVRGERVEIARMIARIDQRLVEIDRRNDYQDAVLDRLRDRAATPPVRN
jgi:hypothetical protein